MYGSGSQVAGVVAVFCSLLFLQATVSLDEEATASLRTFLALLSDFNVDPSLRWNSSDACNFKGVSCVASNDLRLQLDGFNLTGVFDVASLCNRQSLGRNVTYVSLKRNIIIGEVSEEIGNCTNLTHLLVAGNKLSGNLPDSVSRLSNLKQIDISRNRFSGELPDFSMISDLQVFLAQDNQFTGNISKFRFENLVQFNVSNNYFGGEMPDLDGKFSDDSLLGNQGLRGDPLPDSSESNDSNNGPSKTRILMYTGYGALGLGVLALILYKVFFMGKKKKPHDKAEAVNKVSSVEDETIDYSASAASNKIGASRSGISGNSVETAMVSTSLTVVTSSVVNGLRFEDLLGAPAELLGRGKNSTLYKVMLENKMVLIVKRIKDWPISGHEFKQRMQRIDGARHPNVLPVLAYYCSREEKLLVYEYQKNGSLFKLLHGNQRSQTFDWASRLGIAARISQALAFMHRELQGASIPHGNLKSSNILLNSSMEPCLSEYGLIESTQVSPRTPPKSSSFKRSSTGQTQNNKTSPNSSSSSSSSSRPGFSGDIYGLGVILLELLTGKMVQTDGMDLPTWVLSAVREEWTVEVFDKSLISEGANEERLVNLLQVAIKCVNENPAARPNINQVATMLNSLKEEDDRSLLASYDPSSVSFTSSIMFPA